MNLKYNIHRVSAHSVVQDVTLSSGQVVKATVPCAEIEMVPDGHSGSVITLRLTGAEMEAALAEHKQGDSVEVDFTNVTPVDPAAQ